MPVEDGNLAYVIEVALALPTVLWATPANDDNPKSGGRVRLQNGGDGSIAIMRSTTGAPAGVTTFVLAQADPSYRKVLYPGQEIVLEGPISAKGDFVYLPHWYAIAEVDGDPLLVEPLD